MSRQVNLSKEMILTIRDALRSYCADEVGSHSPCMHGSYDDNTATDCHDALALFEGLASAEPKPKKLRWSRAREHRFQTLRDSVNRGKANEKQISSFKELSRLRAEVERHQTLGLDEVE